MLTDYWNRPLKTFNVFVSDDRFSYHENDSYVKGLVTTVILNVLIFPNVSQQQFIRYISEQKIDSNMSSRNGIKSRYFHIQSSFFFFLAFIYSTCVFSVACNSETLCVCVCVLLVHFNCNFPFCFLQDKCLCLLVFILFLIATCFYPLFFP